jgi:predicted nuclease of restriction endonuclease-like (RecB) superfamily
MKDAPDQHNRKQRGTTKADVIFPLPETLVTMPDGYPAFIRGIKEKIATERIKTTLSANAVMLLLYWDIGSRILERQKNEGWGAKVIDRMSYDLKQEFPDMQGFSPRNLKYMRKFAEAWPDPELVQRSVALIPWRSNITRWRKVPTLCHLWFQSDTTAANNRRYPIPEQVFCTRTEKKILNFPKNKKLFVFKNIYLCKSKHKIT